MNVIAQCPHGYLLDSTVSFKSSRSTNNSPDLNTEKTCSHTKVNYLLKQELFAIHEPFIMDSQYQKIVDGTAQVTNSRKKRKRKAELNPGEIALNEYYEKCVECIRKAHEQLILLGQQKGYFTVCKGDNINSANNSIESNFAPTEVTVKQDQVSSDGPVEVKPHSDKLLHGNNRVARNLATELSVDDGLRKLCDSKDFFERKDVQQTSQIKLIDPLGPMEEVVANTITENTSSEIFIMKLGQQHFIVPPKSSFLLSDFCFIDKLIQNGKKYNLIIIDPPWENKSVKRKKMYNSLHQHDLLKIPFLELMDSKCIIAIWVTNKQTQQEFVKEKLFPHFNIKFKAQWYWLKVTSCGIPVYSLDSNHKKPFESIIIGEYGESNNIPEEQVIVSIPCVIHSKKPPIHDILVPEILQKYIDVNSVCLELFARNLLPGWTSWGNEVLKFQNLQMFCRKEFTGT